MRIYIAGPMTGHADMNFPTFHAAAVQLRAIGHEVVNPAEINAEETANSWAACMRSDIAELVKCDALALLPGWHKSKGATLEARIASDLGMDIQMVEDWVIGRSAGVSA